MKIANLANGFELSELKRFPGDDGVKHSAFSPFFLDLYEDMLVYRERFIAIVRLSDLEVSEKVLGAKANPIAWLRPVNSWQQIENTPWTFRNKWGNIVLNTVEGSLHSPYVGFTLWPEKELVKEVYRLAEKGDKQGALELLRPGANTRR